MWKKIKLLSEAISLKKGMYLTQDPETPKDIFEILQINPLTSYITLLHANDKTDVKFMPAEELIKGNWWAKEKQKPKTEIRANQ